ncbi:MAG TPA: prolyl oligopeptidase family serine peptidase, partial [Blastocatellia bacterium]|nr:prolyl oligopeptidase family serine peptidase [Blastocatellia bacterium]
MAGPSLTGYSSRAVRWSGDAQSVFFEWKQASDPIDKDFDTYTVHRDGSGLTKLSDEDARNAPPIGGDTTRNKSRTVYSREGDLFIYDSHSGKTRQITNTTEPETNPHFTADGKRVYFTRAGNLYVVSLEDGDLTQMTDIRPPGSKAEPPVRAFGGGESEDPQVGLPASEKSKSASQEDLKKQQREIFDVIKQREKKQEEEQAKRKREHPRKPLILSQGEQVRSLLLSPSETYVVAFVAVQSEPVARNSTVPNLVTESGYTEDIPGRTKAGDVQPGSRLAVIDVKSGDVKWVDQNLQLPGIEAPSSNNGGTKPATEDREQKQGQPETTPEKASGAKAGKPSRRVRFFEPAFSEDGKLAVIARSSDNKDRWILAVDPATAKSRILASDHDDAWIDGPGAGVLGWLPGNQDIYFQSERAGYSHLYTADYATGEAKQLTSGNWEVTNFKLSVDKTRFLIVTSETAPGERHLYSMAFTGGERIQLTSEPGLGLAEESPDGGALALIYSSPAHPPELFIQDAKPAAQAHKITSSPSPEFSTYHWIDPPIVTFPARDGATIYGRVYKPKDYKAGGPAVVFVHGAGYLQDVDRWWSSFYYREYMFHHFLMEHGYLVFEIDYRGSAGYGRDWRTGIYRHMGGKDLDDHVDAVRWLVKQYGVDPTRIGIYGGSYGGFMTLMAMFTAPDIFAAGAALRPVTNWANYNDPYTSNILNLPQNDPEAYKRSSPIYFASGLKGALLLCHGMADTNVHFQDTAELVQRLIELRKENWELAAYPVESHGFVEPSSWADEYKRIFKLFQENLQPPKRQKEASGHRDR